MTGTADLIKPMNTASEEWAVKQADAICDLHDTSFADTVNDTPLRAAIAAALTLAAAGGYTTGHNAPNWMLESARLEGRKESADALETAERVIERMKQTCLFADDDGGIGVTQDPHVDSDLFDNICDWLARHATQRQGGSE